MTSRKSVEHSLLIHIATPSLKNESTGAMLDVEGLYRVSEHFRSQSCKQLEVDQSNVGLTTVAQPE